MVEIEGFLMKRIYIVLLFVACNYAFSQENGTTERVWRVNFINPGAEVEVPLSKNFTFSANVGVGYGGSYPELTESSLGSGIVYVIAPFLDLQVKAFYNFDKRMGKGKPIKNNSGNFLSARIISRGPSITDNIERKSDFDFAIGPTWGIQREYGKMHLLFDIGPQYYFDTNGNSGFWPLMVQLNLGLNLGSNKLN